MSVIKPLAPTGAAVLEYDRRHLALYAAILDADDAGRNWRDAATDLMRLDVTDLGAEECWLSHLERARWIIGDGLANAVKAFGARPSGQVQD